jgi:hypothetical protein
MARKLDEDRRRAERRVPSHAVIVEAETERLHSRGEVTNLSEGGACLALDRDFAVGDEVILWLTFARPGRPVPATGRVVWTASSFLGDARCGVQWTHAGPQRDWLGWLTRV